MKPTKIVFPDYEEENEPVKMKPTKIVFPDEDEEIEAAKKKPTKIVFPDEDEEIEAAKKKPTKIVFPDEEEEIEAAKKKPTKIVFRDEEENEPAKKKPTKIVFRDEEENEPAKEKPTKSKKRKEKDCFIYGNYKSYYGYRLDQNTKDDPRLAVFKNEWFEGKDCLDIGCNQGIVTIAIAKKFKCRSIVGIDIDEGLIETAYWNLRRACRQANSHKGQVQADPDVDKEMDLSEAVSFNCENFVERLKVSSGEQYDAIVCLSVSKWIHLNWGDEGIITLFAKTWRLLRPGGVFILEPQPWNSYKRNRTVSETARANFQSIYLHPEKFREVLLDKIGFRSAEVITDKLSGTVAGFDRPITAYYK